MCWDPVYLLLYIRVRYSGKLAAMVTWLQWWSTLTRHNLIGRIIHFMWGVFYNILDYSLPMDNGTSPACPMRLVLHVKLQFQAHHNSGNKWTVAISIDPLATSHIKKYISSTCSKARAFHLVHSIIIIFCGHMLGSI